MTTVTTSARANATAAAVGQPRLWANEIGKGLTLVKRRWAMTVIGTLMTVTTYLGISLAIGGGRIAEELMLLTLPGMMALITAATLSVEGAGGIAEEINGGTLEQAQLSPIRPITEVLGRVTALAVEGLVASAVIGIGLVILFGLRYDQHPSVIVPILLTVLDAMGYGLVIVALTLRVLSIGAITHVFNMIIMFFGGMLVPIAIFPAGVEYLARLIPTAAGIQAVNTTLSGEPLSATWSDGTLPFGLVHAAIFIAVGLAVYARNLRKARSEGGVSGR